MKSNLYASFALLFLFGCQQKQLEKTYTPRILTANESFNAYVDAKEDSLSIFMLNTPASVNSGGDSEELMQVKFRDTLVKIQSGAGTDLTDKFSSAQFLNSQKTCMLVQSADSSGLTAPFYMITLKDKKLDIVSLYRPSNGAEDSRFTKGMTKIGRSGYLINNDFFISTVNPKAYLVKRKDEGQRIQGLHFVNSPDRKTIVFLLESSLYQVHYPSGKVFNQPLSAKAPGKPGELYAWIQHNYSWQKNAEGISFLRVNTDADRLVDISEFRS